MSVPRGPGELGESGASARAIFLDLNGTLIEPVRPQRLAENLRSRRVRMSSLPHSLVAPDPAP